MYGKIGQQTCSSIIHNSISYVLTGSPITRVMWQRYIQRDKTKFKFTEKHVASLFPGTTWETFNTSRTLNSRSKTVSELTIVPA